MPIEWHIITCHSINHGHWHSWQYSQIQDYYTIATMNVGQSNTFIEHSRSIGHAISTAIITLAITDGSINDCQLYLREDIEINRDCTVASYRFWVGTCIGSRSAIYYSIVLILLAIAELYINGSRHLFPYEEIYYIPCVYAIRLSCVKLIMSCFVYSVFLYLNRLTVANRIFPYSSIAFKIGDEQRVRQSLNDSWVVGHTIIPCTESKSLSWICIDCVVCTV